MATKTATDRTADEQFEDVINLLYFLAWRKLDGVPHCWAEDFIQDMAIRFLLRLRRGGIRNPRGYLYHFVVGECSDFFNPKKDPAGFVRRRGAESWSREFGGGDDDNDGQDLTLADLVFDPGDGPPILFERQEQEAIRRRIRREVRRILEDDPCGALWRQRAARPSLTYAELGKAVSLTAGQVRGRLSRGTPRLRKRLRKINRAG